VSVTSSIKSSLSGLSGRLLSVIAGVVLVVV
jgi:hypothetical protein